MSSHKKRTYNSETRQAGALQTRARILESAKMLLSSEDIENVTIEKIAHAANVSMPTIYALFQSKRGILRAIIDNALPADQFEALIREAKKTDSAKEHLMISAKIARQIYDAERVQMEAFWGASIGTPEFKELEREREQRRYKRQEESVTMMVKEQSLAKGLTILQARDILWAFTGRDMYRMFVVEQGWSSEDYENWLAQLLVKTLVESDL